MIDVKTIHFGENLIDPMISFKDLSSHFEQIFDFFEKPKESEFQAIEMFTLANAIVLINKTQFETRDQVESIAERFNNIGQNLKKEINPHYYACLGVSENLREYLQIYDQLKCTSFSDAQDIREVALKEKAETILNALKERCLLQDELRELESQKHNKLSAPFESESTLNGIEKFKEFFLSLSGRNNSKVIELHPKSNSEKRISVIKNLLLSSCHEYSISEMQKFLFSCGDKEENFHLVTEFFSVINPFLPGSNMSKEPHARLLIDTLGAISQKHGISLSDSEIYNQYIKDLCNLGVNWLENGKEMKGFVSLAISLRRVAEKIGLEQEISQTLDEMITNAKETLASSSNRPNSVTH